MPSINQPLLIGQLKTKLFGIVLAPTAAPSDTIRGVETASTIRRPTPKNRTRAHARVERRRSRRVCVETLAKRTGKSTCIYDSCRRLESCSKYPIGFEGSRWNLFEGLDGNPLRFLDPYGLEYWKGVTIETLIDEDGIPGMGWIGTPLGGIRYGLTCQAYALAVRRVVETGFSNM
ncbi:hypothetical protein Pla52o_16870 [Novipirellula galeiformis]|uniref:Uncharacterized protein n=1 Tax=Novipirellula galeiformis TaxID=2528004 RepID=A0A5C6CQL5_9BACT|nr:hypothetical protein Pla52o_16870 [Novipirellula galeiformis]